ncbi:nickel pincer cofactor biosynthesis protein LarC [Sporomusa acidovorans]|uniref:Pyridinium-3,5-bisthiocarboxylic acid mononucleotide nickel insertion protein n=1 Tax=Sporomusa acidovorans (strain ATCC 49682 / DSM 3132 / Mol) TaxID=1123286 RepID=A0ABZ3IYI4_SPOA4|nr:nickel pincer cofactor biosynthesis protein LarC [Sporomusa acidovorans]OZC16963.1 hypothetical protein SPACI_40100 [Sporomusa acidovorans DSM 3132]SDE13832.1 hypothetical protein SAMN04488499_1008139 [Sporomusa acidovorans]
MKAIYLDCFSGISGNMMIGALLDAGLPSEYLRAELAKLPVTAYKLIDKEVIKRGIKARYFNVEARQWFQPSRNLRDIHKIISESSLTDTVKEKAITIFNRLGAAEAKVHGVPESKIHFHEVGAIDSIVDIVGIAIGLEYLGIERIFTSELHVGSGYVKCSHGRMPIPAPATAELLKGIPFYSEGVKGELVTPTGAAVVACLAEACGPMPKGFIIQQVAYGAGSMDLEIPNAVRLYMGTVSAGVEAASQEAKIIETNIDDMNPEIYGYVIELLLKHPGVHDAYLTSIMMKKGRPGIKLSVLVSANKVADISRVILRETSSLGVRIMDCDTVHLEKEIVTLETPWGQARVKVGRLAGQVLNVAPEYEDCKAIALKHNAPLKEVYQQMIADAKKLLEAASE